MNDADRYQVVHAGFWWRIQVGDGGVPYGRFYTKAEAERMAALLLREFRNGVFVGEGGMMKGHTEVP